jgi:hypothetical protein
MGFDGRVAMRYHLVAILLLIFILMLTSCNAPVDESAMATAIAATMVALDEGVAGEPEAHDLPDATVVVDEDPMAMVGTETSEPSGPDMLTIAFINGGNVWFVQEDGEPQQLTTYGDVVEVALSTDGQLAAFVRQHPGTYAEELWVVNTSSGIELTLLTQTDLDGLVPLNGALHNVIYQFKFVPGTHNLLMNTRKTFEGPGLVLNNELWSIDAESGARSLLLAPGLGGDFYISPSGNKLALTQATSIAFANIDGTGRSPDHLTFPSVITYSEYAYYPIPIWSGDGSAIVVVIPPEDPFLSDTAQVWRVPLSGAAVPLLDLTGFSFFRNQGKTPMIAPDLSQVAFMRETAPNNFDLVVVPLDGSTESIYVSGDITWQGWNPDSLRAVYGVVPLNYYLVGPGLSPMGLGFGSHLRWVDLDTFLYLDTLSTTHRFSLVNMPGAPSEIAVIAGQVFAYDFTE